MRQTPEDWSRENLEDVPIDAPPKKGRRGREKPKPNGNGSGSGIQDAGHNILSISDFIAYSPEHTYIHRPTGETWTVPAVNSRVLPIFGGKTPLPANVWLDRNDAVEQRAWAPGEPEIIADRLMAEGGFFPKPGARLFNLYKPPTLIRTPGPVQFWRDHLYALWPAKEAEHAEKWIAQRVQRPEIKINHALVLGGKQGLGKDALLAPLKLAVGPWNFTEISPQAVLGAFNDFAQAVVLRISEGKDLGDTGKFDKFAFYETCKTLIAAPPETLRINKKYIRPYYVINIVGVIISTNHKTLGIYLPPDDRRHYVLWSNIKPSSFGKDYFTTYFTKIDAGGGAAVADYLAKLDISGFNPKAPPPHTQAFREIVNASRSLEESEMADVIESLKNPDVLMVSDIIARVSTLKMTDYRFEAFHAFLTDRKNARIVSLRLEECGYRRLANPNETTGRWRIGHERTGVYVRQELSDREGFLAIYALRDFNDKPAEG